MPYAKTSNPQAIPLAATIRHKTERIQRRIAVPMNRQFNGYTPVKQRYILGLFFALVSLLIIASNTLLNTPETIKPGPMALPQLIHQRPKRLSPPDQQATDSLPQNHDYEIPE